MSFHPDSNLPGCMMPDGGDCCVGYQALLADWRRLRGVAQGSPDRGEFDPADIWDAYCDEVPEQFRSCQGAMAFALDYASPPAALPAGENTKIRAVLRDWQNQLAEFEAMKARGDLTKDWGECSLISARRIVGDLTQALPSTHQSANRNWVEDAPHENGNYQCRCCECGQIFIGHKRRVLCKICSDLLTPAVTSTTGGSAAK